MNNIKDTLSLHLLWDLGLHFISRGYNDA